MDNSNYTEFSIINKIDEPQDGMQRISICRPVYNMAIGNIPELEYTEINSNDQLMRKFIVTGSDGEEVAFYSLWSKLTNFKTLFFIAEEDVDANYKPVKADIKNLEKAGFDVTKFNLKTISA